MKRRIHDWNFNLLLKWIVNCICIYLKYIPSCTKWCHRNFLRKNQTIISNHISFEWISNLVNNWKKILHLCSEEEVWDWFFLRSQVGPDQNIMRFTKVTLFHLSVKGCLLYFRLVVLQGKDWKLASSCNNKRRLKEGVATLRLGIMDKKIRLCNLLFNCSLSLLFLAHSQRGWAERDAKELSATNEDQSHHCRHSRI